MPGYKSGRAYYVFVLHPIHSRKSSVRIKSLLISSQLIISIKIFDKFIKTISHGRRNFKHYAGDH